METATHYVLIIADRTAATPALLERVRQRALRGACDFTLVVPARRGGRADEEEARKTLALALPLLREVTRGRVSGRVGPPDPVRAADEALRDEHFDEVIVSTLSEAVSPWLEGDVPARIERPDVPVAVVSARPSGAARPRRAA
jgi:hypothetical protein